MNSVLWGLALAAAMEAVTILFRFGFGLQATRDTRWLRRLTFGLRIHHGYWGVLLLLAVPFMGAWPHLREAAIVLGLGLAVSDLVHHFAVLWPITGSPEFDLRYPDDASPPSRPAPPPAGR